VFFCDPRALDGKVVVEDKDRGARLLDAFHAVQVVYDAVLARHVVRRVGEEARFTANPFSFKKRLWLYGVDTVTPTIVVLSVHPRSRTSCQMYVAGKEPFIG